MTGPSDPSNVDSTAVESRRAARAARRAKPDWSLEGNLKAVRGLVRAVVEHTEDGYGGLAELHALMNVRGLLDHAVDRIAVHLLEHDDASYREIGAALDISLQAAAKRYPNASARQRGGQPGNLR